jgi:hypothetical protein
MSLPNIEAPLQSIGKDPNIITQAVMLAYTGWGYNFYSTTNKLRADDLLIRAKIAGLLSRAAADLLELGRKLAATVPAPTRQEPLPGAETMAVVTELRHLASDIDGVSVKITALSTPGRDKIWDRHRVQDATLIRLQGFDLYLGQLTFDLQALVGGKTAADVMARDVRDDIGAKLAAIKTALREREDALTVGS